MDPGFGPHNMTTNSNPGPFMVSVSSEFPTLQGFRAFSGSLAPSAYWATNGTSTGWLQLYVGTTGKHLSDYSIQCNTVPEPLRMPRNWSMLGSNDGISWDVLDTRSGETAWGSGEIRTYLATQHLTDSYTYFRISVTQNNGDPYLIVGEMYLRGTSSFVVDPEFAPHNMTFNFAPPPFLASASSEYIQLLGAHRAFNGTIDLLGYWTTNGTSTGWLQLYIGTNTKCLTSYSLQCNTLNETARMPRDWTILGSNDGVSWEVLDTRTGETSWTNGERRDYLATEHLTDPYKYFRISVTQNNGDPYLIVGEMYLQGHSPVIEIEQTLAYSRSILCYIEQTLNYSRSIWSGVERSLNYSRYVQNYGPRANFSFRMRPRKKVWVGKNAQKTISETEPSLWTI